MGLPRPRVLDPARPLRDGPSFADASIVLAPALRKLSAAGDDTEALTEAIDAFPHFLLLPLIAHGLSRHVISRTAMKALIVAAGAEALVERFGVEAAARVIERYSRDEDKE